MRLCEWRRLNCYKNFEKQKNLKKLKKVLTYRYSSCILSIVEAVTKKEIAEKKEYARVAQLVEYNLAKVGVAGSSPVSRSH